MKLALLVLFFLLCPALMIYLCNRFSLLGKVGPMMLCYAIGMLVATIGAIPEGSGPVQSNIMNVSIPLALPLLMFSLDLRRWLKLAGRAFFSFGLAVIAVLTAVSIAYAIYHDTLEESWKVAGMLIGVYTGGSINLNAIGLALKAKEHVLVLTNAADMLVCGPYILFMLSIAQRVLNKVLPPFCYPAGTGQADCDTAGVEDFTNYKGIFAPVVVLPLLGAVLLSILVFAVSFLLYNVAPKEHNMSVLMLAITTLGIAGSFIPRVRNIKMTFQLGQYVIMIFCIVVGSLADLRQVVVSAPAIFVFTGIAVFGSLLIHILLAAVFRIDTDTMIITSVAGVFSPPFVPMVAAALKNKEVILSGIATGIIGWVIGNYLGISYAYFLKGLL